MANGRWSMGNHRSSAISHQPSAISHQPCRCTILPVSIRASAAKQIDALVRDLSSPDAVTRDAAAARLTVLGSRAVERLLALAESNAEPMARAAAWRTLEAIGDPRALDPALRALAASSTDPAIGAAAAGVARAFMRGRRSAAVVDRVTAVVLDRARPDIVRRAAL